MGTESLTFVRNKASKMGKKWFWVLLLVPFLGLSQSKRKIRIEAEKQKAALISNLKSHIDYLASDALEGRRTGTAGADAAMDYLVKQYEMISYLIQILFLIFVAFQFLNFLGGINFRFFHIVAFYNMEQS